MKTFNLSNKKFPTLLGIIILVAGIAFGGYLLNKQKAKPEQNPREINISNITDTRFSVSWITDELTIGVVRYGLIPSLETTVKDDRDQISGELGKYSTHHVTIEGLKPKTKYYFKIGSGSEKNLYDNNGLPYEITTAAKDNTSPPALSVNGRILNSDTAPASNVLVYLAADNFLPQSALTDKEGRWIIFLNKARSINLDEVVNIDPKITILTVKAFDGKKNAVAKTIAAHSFPLPDLVLGHPPYDFRETGTEETAVIPEEIPKASPASPGAKFALTQPESYPVNPTEKPAVPPVKEVTIDNPSFDGEKINTLKPDIKGSGPANKVLTIKIESEKGYTGVATIDQKGNWSFIPPENLEPGEHTVTVSYVDDDGQEQTISRQFVALAAGESEIPAFVATPSAGITPAPSPTAPPRVSKPSTESGVPKTGIIEPTLIILTLSLGFLAFGFWLQFSYLKKV